MMLLKILVLVFSICFITTEETGITEDSGIAEETGSTEVKRKADTTTEDITEDPYEGPDITEDSGISEDNSEKNTTTEDATADEFYEYSDEEWSNEDVDEEQSDEYSDEEWPNEYSDETFDPKDILQEEDKECMPRRPSTTPPPEYPDYDPEVERQRARSQRSRTQRSRKKGSQTQKSQKSQSRRRSRAQRRSQKSNQTETENLKSRGKRSIHQTNLNEISQNCVEEFRILNEEYERMVYFGEIQRCKKRCSFEDMMKIRARVSISPECHEQGRRFYLGM